MSSSPRLTVALDPLASGRLALDTEGTATAGASDTVRLAWLTLLALAIRIVAVAVVAGLSVPPDLGSDSSEYDAYAWNVARDRGYRGLSPDVSDPDHLTAYRPPTTPLFYALIYRVFGHSYTAAHLGDCLLSALSVVLLFDLTRRHFDRRAAWLAALGFTFYPLSIFYNVQLLSETMGAFLVLLFLSCAFRIQEPRGLLWSAAAGLALGALLLCKPGFVLLVPLLPLWAWGIGRFDLRIWARVGLMVLVMLGVMAPWVIRNQRVFGRFIPFSTMGGMMMLASNNRLLVEDPNLYGYCTMDNAMPETVGPLKSPDNELLRDDAAKALAKDWVKANPDKWFYMVRSKFIRLWLPWGNTGHWTRRLVMFGPYALILLGATLAIVPLSVEFARRQHPAILFPLLVLSSVGLALIFFGMHRYRFPIDAVLLLLSCVGLVRVWDAYHQGTLGQWPGWIRQALQRHWIVTATTLAALAVLAVLSWLDNRQIERYRDRLCQERLAQVAQAVTRYAAQHGGPPRDLGQLVPGYLANMQPLHCPRHSLEWHQYNQHLSGTDPERFAEAISYRIEPPATPGAPVRIIEFQSQHFGRPNRIEIELPSSSTPVEPPLAPADASPSFKPTL